MLTLIHPQRKGRCVYQAVLENRMYRATEISPKLAVGGRLGEHKVRLTKPRDLEATAGGLLYQVRVVGPYPRESRLKGLLVDGVASTRNHRFT